MPKFNDPTVELTYLEKDDVIMSGSPDDFSNIKAQNLFHRDITRSALMTLIQTNKLLKGQHYLITNATSQNISLLLTAKNNNELFTQCQIIGDNFDIMEYNISTDIFTGVDLLSGVIRNSGGTWAYVDDNEHNKRNLNGVTTTENEVTITYRRTDYNRVLSLNATPDETYVTKGVNCGASVGLALSIIKLQRNDSNYGYVYYDGSGFSILYNRGITTATFNNSNGELTINHDSFGDEAFITAIGRFGVYVPQLQSYGSSSTIIKFFDWNGNAITTPDSNMIVQFSRGYNKQLTNVESEITGANIWITGQMMKEII